MSSCFLFCCFFWGGGGRGGGLLSCVVLFDSYNFSFQSQKDVDKKEGGVFICCIPQKISQFGEFRVSFFTF